MKRFYAPTLAALALAACSDSSTSPIAPVSPEQLRVSQTPYYSKGASGIDGEYIVVFKDGVTGVESKAPEKSARHGGRARFTYT